MRREKEGKERAKERKSVGIK